MYIAFFIYGTVAVMILPSETLSRSGINKQKVLRARASHKTTRAHTQKKNQRHFFHVHLIYMNVTPSLVGSMRLRLFSMYKRLF